MTRADHPSGSDRIFEALRKVDPQRKADLSSTCRATCRRWSRAWCATASRRWPKPGVDIATLAAEIKIEHERTEPSVVKVVGTPYGRAAARCARSISRAPRRPTATARSTITSASTPIGGPRWSGSSSCRPRRWSCARSSSSCGRWKPACASTSRIVDTVPLGVDTPADLERARQLLASRSRNHSPRRSTARAVQSSAARVVRAPQAPSREPSSKEATPREEAHSCRACPPPAHLLSGRARRQLAYGRQRGPSRARAAALRHVRGRARRGEIGRGPLRHDPDRELGRRPRRRHPPSPAQRRPLHRRRALPARALPPDGAQGRDARRTSPTSTATSMRSASAARSSASTASRRTSPATRPAPPARSPSANDQPRAALAPPLAAEIYGLDILASDVEDEAHNTTRFVILAAEPEDAEPDRRRRRLRHDLHLPRPQRAGRALQGDGRLRDQRRQHDQARILPARGHASPRPCSTPTSKATPPSAGCSSRMEELGFFSTELKVLGTYKASPFRRQIGEK